MDVFRMSAALSVAQARAFGVDTTDAEATLKTMDVPAGTGTSAEQNDRLTATQCTTTLGRLSRAVANLQALHLKLYEAERRAQRSHEIASDIEDVSRTLALLSVAVIEAGYGIGFVIADLAGEGAVPDLEERDPLFDAAALQTLAMAFAEVL